MFLKQHQKLACQVSKKQLHWLLIAPLAAPREVWSQPSRLGQSNFQSQTPQSLQILGLLRRWSAGHLFQEEFLKRFARRACIESSDCNERDVSRSALVQQSIEERYEIGNRPKRVYALSGF